ncbi:MAG: hypothetical protein M0T84_04985 [Betaproteobacteria bacterium]|nr:hypothetical protein [Betaproteobacteria bacterium]
MKQSFRQTLKLVAEDLGWRCAYEHKAPGKLVFLKMLANPGALCVACYRWQVFFDSHRLTPLGWLMRLFSLVGFAVSIDSRAEIAGGLVIIHANSIYISEGVRIGPQCILFHQNWIGRSPFPQGDAAQARQGPTIGARAIFGAGACAAGPITIGDDCKIGVNAAVETSFPDGAVAFGVPARQVAKT